MVIERALLVLCAQWTVLLAGIGGGMAMERWLQMLDIRLIVAGVIALGLGGGLAAARWWTMRTRDLMPGSALFLLSNAAIDLMMIEGGTSAHLAGSAASAFAAAAAFCAAASVPASLIADRA